MNHEALSPYDHALWDFYHGDHSSPVIVHRDDGLVSELEMEDFFRDVTAFSAIELKAVDLCQGIVLDAGAGAGNHSLELQKRGHLVISIDVASYAVEIMKNRGLQHAHCMDLFDTHSVKYDTVLMMMHGIGLVGTLDGLDYFLDFARMILNAKGLLLFDSLDVRCTENPIHLKYQQQNQDAGRYFGEIRFSFEYKGQMGPYLRWLHVDPVTLQTHATQKGWESTIVHQESDGNYLACLTPTTSSED